MLTLDQAAVHLQSSGNYALLDFAGAEMQLAGTGEVLFEGNGSRNWLRPLVATGTLTIDSGITIHGPNSGVVGANNVSIVNRGRIVAEAGSNVTVQAPSVRNEGVLEALSAGILSLTNLLNAGLLNADVGGVASIAGPFTLPPAGLIQISIAGVLATEFGRINVSGLASLDGVIRPILSSEFIPALGQTFRVMTFGSRAGSFASVEDGNPGDGVY
jgi:hypothetical protein